MSEFPPVESLLMFTNTAAVTVSEGLAQLLDFSVQCQVLSVSRKAVKLMKILTSGLYDINSSETLSIFMQRHKFFMILTLRKSVLLAAFDPLSVWLFCLQAW